MSNQKNDTRKTNGAIVQREEKRSQEIQEHEEEDDEIEKLMTAWGEI